MVEQGTGGMWYRRPHTAPHEHPVTSSHTSVSVASILKKAPRHGWRKHLSTKDCLHIMLETAPSSDRQISRPRSKSKNLAEHHISLLPDGADTENITPQPLTFHTPFLASTYQHIGVDILNSLSIHALLSVSSIRIAMILGMRYSPS